VNTSTLARKLAIGTLALASLILAGCSSVAPSANATSSSTSKVTYSGAEKALPTSYGKPTLKDGYSFTIGWLAPTLANPFVEAAYNAGKKETAKLGGKFIGLDAGLDVSKQLDECNQLLAENVTAIAVYPVDPGSLAPCLAKASAAGIPVIGEDTPPEAGKPLLANYISSVQQGIDYPRFLTAQYAATLNQDSQFATIGLVIPVPLLQYSIARATYWANKFGFKPTVNVLAQAPTPQAAADAANTIITRYPKVKVIFAYDDGSAAAAAHALAAAGHADVRVYGITGQQSTINTIKAGDGVTATILLNPAAIGVQEVWGLYDTLTKQHLPLPAQVRPNATLVTKANAAQVTGIAG